MRWSSEPQCWGDSERRQQQQAFDWCQRHGKTLSELTFADRGVSGWKGANRSSGALGALLKTVGPGDTILIEDTDRWSREKPLDSLTALQNTVNNGVSIVFLRTGVTVNKDNFNDPGVLFPNFFGSFLANQENEKKSFRIREVMASRRKLIEGGNPGYSFAGWTWSGDGVTNWVTDLSPFTITVSANSNLVANFVPLGSSTITTLVSPASAGLTTGGGTYTNEVTATIAATAADCYSFLYWTTNGVPFSSSPTNMISVTTNEVFTANFAPISYDIAMSASAGGTASGGGSYNCGAAVTFQATPNPCNSFVNCGGSKSTLGKG
jgi:DNA invertase Pin-like site-specific DNA recombinase